MYAVIFTAQINQIDDTYSETAKRMRELAETKYGCTEFLAVTEGTQEIAISYWDTQEQIKQWKHDAEHLVAQELGRFHWYISYKVEIAKVIRKYSSQQ